MTAGRASPQQCQLCAELAGRTGASPAPGPARLQARGSRGGGGGCRCAVPIRGCYPGQVFGRVTMAGARRRNRGQLATLAAVALSLVVSVVSNAPAAAGSTPLPAALRITSVTDTSHQPALPLPVAHQPFAVSFDVVDSGGTIVRAPNVTVVLSPLNGSGLLTASPAISTNGHGVIHAIYSVALHGLRLKLSSPGLLSVTVTLNISAGGSATGFAGVPITLTAGDISQPTGLAVANLSNGATGPVTLTIGPCIPDATMSCVGALTEFSLTGNFKDGNGAPLYSNAVPASVSWTCNEQVCPSGAFVPGLTTATQLQVQEFLAHTMYVSLRNPNGTYQPFAPAPACNGVTGAPLPTGTINPQATGGRKFCVDVGAIRRANEQCQATCSSWSGPLTLPVLFVEDPRFVGT